MRIETTKIPIVLEPIIHTGPSLRERTFFINNVKNFDDEIRIDMTAREIFLLITNKMHIEHPNFEIACLDDSGSILILNPDGSNLSEFMNNIKSHWDYMQKQLAEIRRTPNYSQINGYIPPTVIMVKV